MTACQSDVINAMMFKSSAVDKFNRCLEYVLGQVDLDKLEKCSVVKDQHKLDFVNSFLYPGHDLLIDQHQKDLYKYSDQLDDIVKHLGTHLTRTRGKKPAIESLSSCRSTSVGYTNLALVTTDHKAKTLLSAKKDIDRQLCGDITSVKHNKGVIITSEIIDNLCYQIEKSKNAMKTSLYQHFYNMVATMATQYNFFSAVADFVAMVDFIKSGARSAINNKYFKPIIDLSDGKDQDQDEEVDGEEDVDGVEDVDGEDVVVEGQETRGGQDASFLIIKQLRHPIIEKIINYPYVPNNLSMGKLPSHIQEAKGVTQVDSHGLGLLCYGTNASGKSSLAKAIGLAIIMAQTGLYVPGYMTYRPYNRIVTRLSGNDDLLKGRSSFEIEMLELRTILRNADSQTLVIGDELCRGTESDSGTSLTIATLMTLVERQSSYIFSTHMHNLPETEWIKNMGQADIRICHLSTEYDKVTGKLVYDRILKDTSGPSIYGLAVAKSLDLDTNFIDLANTVRKELTGDTFMSNKRSKYNKRVIVDRCAVCGKRDGTRDEVSFISKSGPSEPLHTHHIREQGDADENGYVDIIHKNSTFNLMVLCQQCHQRVHASDVVQG